MESGLTMVRELLNSFKSCGCEPLSDMVGHVHEVQKVGITHYFYIDYSGFGRVYRGRFKPFKSQHDRVNFWLDLK